MKLLLTLLPLLAASLVAEAQEKNAHQPSKYAGQEKRAITSLSSADIDELRRGGGWGLAKPAELNGVPGPAHLLELKDKIPLSQRQVAEIKQLREEMRKQAIRLGRELITGEAKLDKSFRSGGVTSETLRQLLNEIGEIREQLRYVHLATHLKTPEILTTEQISRYNKLRGYDLSSGSSGSHGHKHGGGKHH